MDKEILNEVTEVYNAFKAKDFIGAGPFTLTTAYFIGALIKFLKKAKEECDERP